MPPPLTLYPYPVDSSWTKRSFAWGFLLGATVAVLVFFAEGYSLCPATRLYQAEPVSADSPRAASPLLGSCFLSAPHGEPVRQHVRLVFRLTTIRAMPLCLKSCL